MFEDNFEQLRRTVTKRRKTQRAAAYDILHEFDETRYENNRAKRQARWDDDEFMDMDEEITYRSKRREPRYDRSKRM